MIEFLHHSAPDHSEISSSTSKFIQEKRPNSRMMWQIISLLVIALCLSLNQCHQIPHSEPYSYHYNPYSYGYDIEDNYGNKQWKQENSHNPQEVHGSYGYRDKNGVYREVTYVADKNGFRASIKTNEPGLAGTKEPAAVKLDSYYPSQSYTHAKYVSAPSYPYGRGQAEVSYQ